MSDDTTKPAADMSSSEGSKVTMVAKFGKEKITLSDLSSTTTIGDVKTMLQSHTAILPKRQKLIGLKKNKGAPGGATVDDDTPIADLKVKGSKGSEIVHQFILMGTPEENIFIDPHLKEDLPDIIDDFDLDWTPNTSDAAQRRYRFGHQADIARWNLSRLAYALAPLVSNIDDYIDHLEAWPDHFRKRFTQMLCTKLGTLAGTEEGIKVSEAERVLIKEALPIWQNAELDMTIFFRTLNRLTPKDSLQTWQSEIRHSLYQDQGRLSAVAREEGRQALWEWLANLRTHLSLTQARQDPERRQAIMNQVNPAYVLRNYLAQEAIEALEAGNEDPLHQLHHILKTPYTEQKGGEVYQQLRPEWARHKPGCSRLSCSS